MSEMVVLSFLSVIIVSLISLIGVLALALNEKYLRKIVSSLIGFAAGGLLGDAFIHLIPEAAEAGFSTQISLFILLGIVVSFLIEKIIHWRHHHYHHHNDAECKPGKNKEIQPFAYMNLVGDGIHNFIDGLIIGASYLVSIPIGVATTLAVIFHEIPQEIGDFGVLLHGGFSKKRALFFNFLSAVMAILGVAISLLLGSLPGMIEFLIPFAAGSFVYIAGSDLIPELHHEPGKKKAVMQLIALLVGMGLMWALLFLE